MQGLAGVPAGVIPGARTRVCTGLLTRALGGAVFTEVCTDHTLSCFILHYPVLSILSDAILL